MLCALFTPSGPTQEAPVPAPVCMCVCVLSRMPACARMSVYVHVRAYVCVCVSVCGGACACQSVGVCLCVRMRVRVSVWVRVSVRVYVTVCACTHVSVWEYVCVCMSVCMRPPIAKGMSPFLSETSGTHQGVVEDLPEVRVQMVGVIAGSGQEAAEFVLIAQVEEDALEWGGGCEEMRVAASQHPSFGRPGPTHLVPQALTEGHVRVCVAA